MLPQLQIYGTAGMAGIKLTGTVVCSTTGAVGCFPALAQTSTTTRIGWTAGAGLEWKVWDHLLLRGEYRYNDYGTWKQNAFIGSGQIEEFADVHVKSQMATFGIAYLFGVPKW